MPKDLSTGYASNYRERERALRYLGKYETQWTKRLSTRREKTLIRLLLRDASAAVGPLDTLLDIPCGPGRLVASYAPIARRLVVADVSPAMVALARENAPETPGLSLSGVALDGLSLPFADRSFDCVISIRLAHHLRGQEAFRRYLSELTRVSRKAVLFTFFSSRSVKNRLRGAAVALGRRSPKNVVDPGRVRAWASGAGFDLGAARPLSRLASGHLYALLVRREFADKGWVLDAPEPLRRRAQVYRLPACPGRPYAAVLKRYPAWSLRARRDGSARALREWETLLDLRACGASVVRPLAAWGEGSGPVRRGVLITEEILSAVSLRDLARGGDRRRLEQAFLGAAGEIGLLHARGWVLIGSFAKNVLVTPSPARVVLIDLPHAFRAGGWGGGALQAAQALDLAKLYKGIRPAVGPELLRKALGAYLERRRGAAPPATAVEEWAARVERVLRLKESRLNTVFVGAKRLVRRSIRLLLTQKK